MIFKFVKLEAVVFVAFVHTFHIQLILKNTNVGVETKKNILHTPPVGKNFPLFYLVHKHSYL